MARVRFSWRLDGQLVGVLALITASVALAGLYATERTGFVQLAAALLLSIAAGLIAAHDFRTYWIPDRYTALFAALGALVTAVESGTRMLAVAVAVGVFVGLCLWGLAYLYERLSGRVGLGFGDIKLIAASALLVSPSGLVVQLGLAATLALGFAIWRARRRGRPLSRATRVPFGMALAPAAVCVWAGGWVLGA